jgi:hypothetical protein
MLEGIHKQWKLARLKKELRCRLDHPDYGSDTSELAGLKAYLEETGDWRSWAPKGIPPSVDLDLLGLLYQRQGAFAVLDGDEAGWERLALGAAHVLRAAQFNLVFCDREYARTKNQVGNFSTSADVLAEMVSLGWMEEARDFGTWLISGVLKGYCSDSKPGYRRPARWFYLRLFADFAGLNEVVWPEHAVTVAEYQALLDHWRQPNGEVLLPQLLAVCDRHTHECFGRSNLPDKQQDFQRDTTHGWPIEIHLLMRLRAQLGLETPMPEHPLMQTGLGRLPEIRPMPTNELLDAVTNKVCAIYPELRSRLGLGAPEADAGGSKAWGKFFRFLSS